MNFFCFFFFFCKAHLIRN